MSEIAILRQLTPNLGSKTVYLVDCSIWPGGQLRRRLVTKTIRFVWMFALLASTVAMAQTNPVPFINQPLVPMTVAPGGSGFTLTVNGTEFVSTSVVNWNGTALATTFVTGSQLTATVPASDIATPSTASVTVTNPAPGGGVSNAMYFDIADQAFSLVFSNFYSNFSYDNFAGIGSSIIAADFNGDGKLDLALADYISNELVIELGNGDGTFQAPLYYPVGGNSQALFAADFNGDGKLDIAVANAGDNTVSILLGNGDGTFQAAKTFATGNFPLSVASGDFNGDGKLDLAVACNGSSGGDNGGVSILLGNGDGTFQTHMDYGTQVNSHTMALGDFNGDGKLDIALVELVACRSEFVTADAAGGVRVFPLNGPSIGRVGIDVAAEFASQVGNRGEDTARDDLAFDLSEPDLDLIEPGRVSGREVKPDSRML